MTLIEFLAPLKNGSHKDRVLATMYYTAAVEGVTEMQPGEVRDRLVAARVPRARDINISQVLARSGHLVDRADTSFGYWALTDSGREHVENELGLFVGGANTSVTPVTAITKSLGDLIQTVSDNVVRDYLEEALSCLGARAFRAAIVFVWTGAIRTLEEHALAAHSGTDIATALRKHDPNARKVGRVADFANVKDSVELFAFHDLGIVDKGERQTLEEALNLRNRCGHPTTYKPGEAKVAAFLEDVIGIVFA